MSLKCFNADVRAARSHLHETPIPGIVAIERGDSEGEVVVTLVYEKLPEPLPIRLLARNIDEYPAGNTFLLFIDSDVVVDGIATALETLQDFTSGQKVFEAITTLSTGIQCAIDRFDSDGDINMDRGQGLGLFEDEPEDDDDDADYEESDDYLFNDEDFGSTSMNSHISIPASETSSNVLQRIRHDLRKAREAGCKVGILGGLETSIGTRIISLSIRARKLCLSQEALEAWDIESSEYIVLLLRIDDLYPSADRIMEQPSVNFHIQFRFGKCTRYKPSIEQARAAFATTAKEAQDRPTLAEIDDKRFQKIFISKSLEQFMNESFVPLVKLRFRTCATWDDANAELRSLSSTFWTSEAKSKARETAKPTSANNTKIMAREAPGHPRSGLVGKYFMTVNVMHECSTCGSPAERFVTDNDFTDEYQNTPKALPTILFHDSFTDPEPSVPLMAMQFAIHYFVRCTEYCLRCHRPIDKEFEALKPFVCSDPLCLFQYMTMGLGPSIEHEITTNPYVVDLLVNLCYSSLQRPVTAYHPQPDGQFPIRDFPSGLRLKCPNTMPNLATAGDSIKVHVDLKLKEVEFSSVSDFGRIHAGTWVVLRHDIAGFAGQNGQSFLHHAYIKYVDHQASSFTIDLKRKDLYSLPFDGKAEMDLFVYNTDLDDMTNVEKAKAMLNILDTLPPIAHIREYLIKNPQSRMRSYHDVSPAAATLLEWIVASNRSCIFQVSPIADPHVQDTELLATVRTRDQDAIPSMSSCVQFRFAQGAPDKELRFHRALGDLKAQKRTDFPTLFAWHGSALSNWHSILRHGLDFNQVVNGRAFGDGVYFSQNFHTSTGYAAKAIPGSTWSNSALNGSGVIALCEIINAPEMFVSISPHLVINQVDWIQCRYLIVEPSGGRPHPASSSNGSKEPKTASIPQIPQDPVRSVRGPDLAVLQIPLKAIPSRYVARQPKEQPSTHSSSKRTHEMASSSGDSDEEDPADVEYLFSGDEGSSEPSTKRVTTDSERASSVDTDTATTRQVTARRPLTPPQTDFRPGTLDLNTLPQLPVPEWANSNSTRRLASDIKHMQKVQASTPLHELGWYINFDKLDNMFQWIVELHSFEPSLPLAQDMKQAGINSIVLEVRFGREYPFSPPFVRVIRPRFLPFASGGGGHVTIGGAMCLELLTSTGWSPVTSMEAVFLSVKMAMSETEPVARLDTTKASARTFDYGANEALEAYVRFAQTHEWRVPTDLRETAGQVAKAEKN